MEQTNEKYMHSELTSKIINCYYKVYNALGYGFTEKVYERALIIELKSAGFTIKNQAMLKVYYANQVVGEYFADLIIDDKVILELKAADVLISEFEAQLDNYLRATEMEVGLLMNFGPKPEVRRRVFHNHLKKSFPKLPDVALQSHFESNERSA
jgi:GxxExxY protein